MSIHRQKINSLCSPRLSACPCLRSPNLDANFQTWMLDISRTTTRWDATEVRIPTSVPTHLHLSSRCIFHARALPYVLPSPTPLPLRYARRPMGLPAGGRSLTVPQTPVCAAERGINTFSVCAAPGLGGIMIRGDPELPPTARGRAARPLTPGSSVLLVHGAL